MNRYLRMAIAPALVALIAAASGAAAQSEAEPIRFGEVVAASLTGDGPRLANEAFRAYRFDGVAGTRYRITMRSDDFEPFLRVGRNIGGVTDYLLLGGNHGLGAGAELVFTPVIDATYLAVVQAEDASTGSFTLIVEPGAEMLASPLVLDQPAIGIVDDEVIHTFAATAGRELEITVRSRDFDTLLEVGQTANGRFVPIDSDDDGAGGTDSRIYFTPTADGEYAARVTAFGGGEAGGYAILLAIPVQLSDPLPFRPDAPVTGELTDRSDRTGDDTPFVEWELTGDPESRYRVDLQSTDFDAYLSVGRREGRRFIEIASNDDAGLADLGTTDARVILHDLRDGNIIRVRAFDAEERGRYSLIATPLPPVARSPGGGTIQAGSTITASIGEMDAILPDGTPFQEWRLTAAAGQSYIIELASSEFDTFLSVGRLIDGNYRELDTNDDTDTGTDSRLEFTAPETGEYLIRVRPYLGAAVGSYTLSVRSSP